MPLTENTKKAIQYLSSIAHILSQYGDENKGISQYMGAKEELNRLSEIIINSEELTISEKEGMNKLIHFLRVEVDKKINLYNSSGY